MKEDGCTKVAMTNDKEVYGAGLARVIELSAKEQGLELIANDAIDKNASNYRSLAQKAKAAGADCFVYSGITANNAVQQFKDFAAALGRTPSSTARTAWPRPASSTREGRRHPRRPRTRRSRSPSRP